MFRLSLLPLVAGCLCLASCAKFDLDGDDERPTSAPNTVVKADGALHLTAAQQANLGLQVAVIESRKVQATLATIGWLQTRAGSEVIVKSPATGFVVPTGDEQFSLGKAVYAQHEMATLEVFLSPQEQATLVTAKEEADAVIHQAEVSLELARGQWERVKAARDTAAGTRLLDLEETVRRNEVAIREARERLPYLPVEPYTASLKLKPLSLTAPLPGVVRQLHVAPRQLVTAGDPLWTLADLSKLWVRVAVFQGDMPRLISDQPASLTMPGSTQPLAAKPLRLPQTVEPGQRMVDVFYEVLNSDLKLRPGEAVNIALPTGAEVESLLVPRSALVWDRQGNAWLYVRTADDEFRRRRVELGATFDDHRVVERGLKASDVVVTTGAQALYGAEFQDELQAGDDD